MSPLQAIKRYPHATTSHYKRAILNAEPRTLAAYHLGTLLPALATLAILLTGFQPLI